MKKLVVILLISLLAFMGCKKESHRTLIAIHDFPVSVGSWWQYTVYNGYDSVYDTATVRILDVTVVGNIPYQRWSETSVAFSSSDTIYEVAQDSAMLFCYTTDTNSQYVRINFPIIENENWGPSYPGISYTTSIQSVTVNGMTFGTATYLNAHKPDQGGGIVDESMWIVKGIGIVRHKNFYQGIGDRRLLAYHIN